MRFLRALLPAALLLAPPRPATAQADPFDRAPSRFASYAGGRIHYKSLGTGRRAVVFVHGWASDLSVWRYQAAALDGRARLIALDLPGHGRSSAPDRDYTMRFYAEAVRAVLDAAGVERAVLVGHSMGTPVIREFYRMAPGRTDALVVVDGNLRAPGLDSAAVERQVALFRGPEAKARWAPMIEPMLPGPERAVLRRRLIATAESTPENVVTGSIRGMMDPAIWGPDPIKVPLLVVVAKGPNWPSDYRTFVAELAPDLRYEELAGVHHFLMLERPDLFNPILIEFLRAQGALAA
ncbi:MAG: alpha/beta hydrolase [Gemmatimonadales bacterium]